MTHYEFVLIWKALMLKSLVISPTETLPEYRKCVDDAAKDYSSSIVDLGVALNAEILSKGNQIEKGVKGISNLLNGNCRGRLSLSMQRTKVLRKTGNSICGSPRRCPEWTTTRPRY